MAEQAVLTYVDKDIDIKGNISVNINNSSSFTA